MKISKILIVSFDNNIARKQYTFIIKYLDNIDSRENASYVNNLNEGQQISKNFIIIDKKLLLLINN